MPVLEAAHIKRYSEGGVHDPPDGLLLRSDLNRLFDLSYMSINPEDHRCFGEQTYPGRIKNGREGYALHRRELSAPGTGQRCSPVKICCFLR